MCKIDWKLVIDAVAAIGSIAVAIMAIWGDWVKQILVGPKLRVELQKLVGSIGNYNGEKAIYYHLTVVNDRAKTPALNCKVILVEIQKENKGTFSSNEIPYELSFRWAPSDQTNITETVYDKKNFDFIALLESNVVVPCVSRGLGKEAHLNGQERIRYGLQVIANGIRTKTQFFEVTWDGTWAMQDEQTITIQKISSK